MAQISHFAEAWMSMFVLHMIEISIFIILVWAIDRSFDLHSGLRYLLWLIALVKIFIPPIFSLPVNLSDSASGHIFFQPILLLLRPKIEIVTPAFVLLNIWMISVLLFLGTVIHQNIVLRRLLRRAKLLDVSSLSRTVHPLLCDTPIFTTELIQAPILIGYRKPRIYLPGDWSTWSQSHLRSILAHEMAHLRYRDMWVLGLQTVSVIIFGLNPMVWLVYKRLNHIRELHCDESAIEKTGISAIEYSKLIYSFIEKGTKYRFQPVTGTYFSENNHNLIKRLSHLLNLKEVNMKPKTFWPYTLPVLLGLVILPFSWKCEKQFFESQDKTISESGSSEEGVFFSGTVFLEEGGHFNFQLNFQPYDVPPKPIGGFAAIQKNLKYPEEARKAGIEGRVIVQLLIDARGEIVDRKILKSIGNGNSSFEEAAVNALKSVKWQAAEQNGEPVKVWVAVPVIFKLYDE